MKAAKTRIYRQGDVLLRAISRIPKEATRGRAEDGKERIVLAYGEVTGHAHAIHDVEKVDVFVGAQGQLYLAVKEGGVTLKHEEHGAITLPPGNYERVLQREYSPEAIRNVAD